VLEREGPPERASCSNCQTYGCYGISVWIIAGTESTEDSTKGTKMVVSISYISTFTVHAMLSIGAVLSHAFDCRLCRIYM
jgi:hypothetical protein